MIRRDAEESLIRLAGQFPVVAITGPRQSGKTTLAKAVFPDKEYVSFDNFNMRMLATDNPADFLKAFPKGVIIDEAQKVPEIFDALKEAVDEGEYTPGKYILTGSSQFRLHENISESLAGRAGLLKLLPFSIQELGKAGLLSDEPYDYAFGGFYPPLYDSGKHYIREDWLENYIATYLDMDVRDQINATNIRNFRKFLTVCAIHSGQMLNMESISRDLGLSGVTVKSWLSMLEASFIIHFLEPDSNNLGRTVVKTPKLYFTDTGLLCYLLRIESREQLLLSPYKGAVVETMAVSEMLKHRYNMGRHSNLTYFRDKNGFEVDAVAEWNGTFAIEVKSDSKTEKKLSGNVKKYLEERPGECAGMVYYLGRLSMEIDGIKYVSWKEWGK